MDTNADTTALGSNFVVLEYTMRTADVYSYNKLDAPIKDIPIVTGATAWTDPISDETYTWFSMKRCIMVQDWIIL